MGWGELPAGTVNSRRGIGIERGAVDAKAAPARRTDITDAVVVAVTRQWKGSTFDPDDKALVRDVLAAGLRAGFAFSWIDTEYVEAS